MGVILVALQSNGFLGIFINGASVIGIDIVVVLAPKQTSKILNVISTFSIGSGIESSIATILIIPVF